MLYKMIIGDVLIGVTTTPSWCSVEITESEYNAIMQKIQSKPADPEGGQYRLRADTLEWELVELPPAPEYEPTIEDKAEAYDILIGGAVE